MSHNSDRNPPDLSVGRFKPSTPKLRLCKGCRERKPPFRPGAQVCSISCSETYAKLLAEKKQRAEAKVGRVVDRERKVKLKSLGDWIAETQTLFNRYIRLRDAGLPCICCGRYGGEWSKGGIWDAGHYRSRGSAGHLRFDVRNVHRQLKQCNSYGAGRHSDFRIGLIARIGISEVEALESDHTVHKWTLEELKQIQAIYKLKIKSLQALVGQ